MLDVFRKSHSKEYPKVTLKAEIIGNRSLERHKIKWEVVGKEATRLLHLSHLENDNAEWNILETEFMGGQGLTAGCSAAGGME